MSEILEPNLDVDRSESELPRERKSKIETLDPQVDFEYTDIPDPNLAKLLRDNVDARWVKSNMLVPFTPSLAKDRRLIDEPSATESKTDSLDPSFTPENTDKLLPNRITDLMESDDPKWQKSTTLSFPPNRANDRIERLLPNINALNTDKGALSAPTLVLPKTLTPLPSLE
jgi:hypothetical protein